MVVVTEKRDRLVQRRKMLGLSQELLAERLGIDPTTVRRWENGTSEGGPKLWLRPKLARALQVSPEQLNDLLADIETPDSPGERLAHALHHPSSIDLTAVAGLRDEIHELDERYDRAPSTSLLALAGQYLGQAGFLRQHATTARVRRELYAAEAESATLMGQLVWDASQRRDNAGASRYFDQAIDAARQVGDPVAEGLALLRKSYVALYGQKDAEAGLTLTQQTAETTRRTSHALTGLAVLHAAEAHAMLGQRSDCERALSEAQRRFDRVTDSDPALDLFSPTQHGRVAGSCYLFLDRPHQAQPILNATATELTGHSKSQAIVFGNLGVASLRQTQLDDAAAFLHQAIDIIEKTRGGGGLNIVFSACQEMRPWRHIPAVQEVYDRVFALMAA
jgi:transcriptional regulator with XRE-family HTH domain